MSKKVALITGITGQDGSYLSELLLQKGYDVHGIIRRTSWPNTGRIDHVFDPTLRGQIHYGDVETDFEDIIFTIKPDEIYNLASMSHVRISFEVPKYTLRATGEAVVNLLEAIRIGIKIGVLKKDVKFYQASSSEMYGTTPGPQNENSPFLPVSPYGCAKLYGYHITRTYRFGYGIFAANGILFNHESERRGINFVTRKVTRAVARIKLGLLDSVPLGNLDAKRDWGHARDYMEAIYLILQHDTPDDWVVSTGECHTVREFVEEAFAVVGLDPWKYVKIEDHYRRPVEVPELLGDSTKLRKVLGWEPQVSFKELIRMMVESDLKEEGK